MDKITPMTLFYTKVRRKRSFTLRHSRHSAFQNIRLVRCTQSGWNLGEVNSYEIRVCAAKTCKGSETGLGDCTQSKNVSETRHGQNLGDYSARSVIRTHSHVPTEMWRKRSHVPG